MRFQKITLFDTNEKEEGLLYFRLDEIACFSHLPNVGKDIAFLRLKNVTKQDAYRVKYSDVVKILKDCGLLTN